MSMTDEYYLQTIRKECFDEQMLIAQRMSWTLTIEAFLFSTYAISLSNGSIKEYWWFTFVLLPIAGSAAAFLGKGPVDAAIRTIDFWHKKEDDFYASHPQFDALSRKERGAALHTKSMRFPRLFPVSALVVWIALGGIGLLQGWFKIIPPLP